MTSVYHSDRENRAAIELPNGEANIVYRCANTRKCYWFCRECLKGHGKCSPKCPDYLSVAKVKRQARENNR